MVEGAAGRRLVDPRAVRLELVAPGAARRGVKIPDEAGVSRRRLLTLLRFAGAPVAGERGFQTLRLRP